MKCKPLSALGTLWSDCSHAVPHPPPRGQLTVLQLLVQTLKALVWEKAHKDLQETKGKNTTKYCGVNKIWFAEAD